MLVQSCEREREREREIREGERVGKWLIKGARSNLIGPLLNGFIVVQGSQNPFQHILTVY